METQLNKVRREAREYEQKMKELEEEVNALEVQCDALEHKPSTLGVCVHSLLCKSVLISYFYSLAFVLYKVMMPL